jgi:hypothetical protein
MVRYSPGTDRVMGSRGHAGWLCFTSSSSDCLSIRQHLVILKVADVRDD